MFYLIEPHDENCIRLAEDRWQEAHHFTLYQSSTRDGISGLNPDFVFSHGNIENVAMWFLDILDPACDPVPLLIAIEPVIEIVKCMARVRMTLEPRVLH